MTNYTIAPDYSKCEDFVHHIEQHFAASEEVITHKRNIIKILECEQQKVVVKSFKIPNIVNRFAYRFIRDSKAKRSFLNAQKLQELGINTPDPIAYIEFFTPLLTKSFYISSYFAFDFEIRDVLKDPDFEKREEILEAFAAFSWQLHEKGVYHIDYSPGNVLIKKEKDRYIFSIVDVNRMKFITFDNDLRFKNLSRFSASLKDTDFIAQKYASLANIDTTYAVEKLRYYHNRHQQYRQRKEKLKVLKKR